MREANVPLSFEALLVAMLLLLFVPVLVSAEWVSSISRSLFTIVMLASLYLVSIGRWGEPAIMVAARSCAVACISSEFKWLDNP